MTGSIGPRLTAGWTRQELAELSDSELLGIVSSLPRFSQRPYVNSSLNEEPVMDSIAHLVPGPADYHRPRCSVIGVTIPPPCYLVTSRTARPGRLTAHR